MTADDYRNAPLPANRAPELRIAWRCDTEGYVTAVYLLGAAKEGEPAFIDVVRKYRGGSVLEPHDIVWPKGYAAHYGVHQMDRVAAAPNNQRAA